jgi:hypothetical protein
MSNENLQHGDHSEVDYEHRDLSSRAVFIFLITLGALIVLIVIMMRGFYSYLDSYEREHQAPPSPLSVEVPSDTRAVPPDARNRFPEPRLEVDERTQLNGFILDQERQLSSYSYVDQQTGVVRIPIERAMQLVAQRGLPVRPSQTSVSAAPAGKNKPAKAAPAR